MIYLYNIVNSGTSKYIPVYTAIYYSRIKVEKGDM